MCQGTAAGGLSRVNWPTIAFTSYLVLPVPFLELWSFGTAPRFPEDTDPRLGTTICPKLTALKSFARSIPLSAPEHVKLLQHDPALLSALHLVQLAPSFSNVRITPVMLNDLCLVCLRLNADVLLLRLRRSYNGTSCSCRLFKRCQGTFEYMEKQSYSQPPLPSRLFLNDTARELGGGKIIKAVNIYQQDGSKQAWRWG